MKNQLRLSAWLLLLCCSQIHTPALANLVGAECWDDGLCRANGCPTPDPDCGGPPAGEGGGGGGGGVCKTVTLRSSVFYNDQRKYGRFPLRYDEAGNLGVQYAVKNGDNRSNHNANYLGMYDAKVEIYEVDRNLSGSTCYSTSLVGST